MLTLDLEHLGGTRKTVTVTAAILGAQAKCLIVKWDIAGEYCLDVVSNYLVIMKGGKITRRLQWRAVDRERAQHLWERLRK